jgi:excinuclease ABC subunit C
VRDEAHRFAITFHRKKRSASMTTSLLDSISGLGPAKREALRKHFGTMKKMRAASVEELGQVPGIGPVLAATVFAELAKADTGAPAVNMTTGEVLS